MTFLYFSHPNDEKEGRFHRNHSITSLGSLRHNHNHVHDTSLPLVAQDHDTKSPEHEKEVFGYFAYFLKLNLYLTRVVNSLLQANCG